MNSKLLNLTEYVYYEILLRHDPHELNPLTRLMWRRLSRAYDYLSDYQ